MRPVLLLVLGPLLLLLATFRGRFTAWGAERSTHPAAAGVAEPAAADAAEAGLAAPAPRVAPEHAVVARGGPRPARRLEARLVPSDASEVRLDLRTPRELTFVDVAAHGAVVNEGDVVARFDARELDREVERAHRAVDDAERALASAEVRARLDGERAVRTREAAERAERRARAALEAWRETETVLDRRGRDLAAQGLEHAIADAEEELRQLEAMYRDDELVEATEEIVLARSRRNLATMRAQRELSLARRAHEDGYGLPLETARREEAAADAAFELQRLGALGPSEEADREAGVAAARVALEEARARLADLTADRAQCELRAPRSGVVLHGATEAWSAGGTRPDLRAGSTAHGRGGVLVVAEPDRLRAVALVDAGTQAHLEDRGAVELESAWGAHAAARLESASYPRPDGRYVVTAVPERPLPGLRAGAPVEVVVRPRPEERELLVVPPRAVWGTGGEAWCWVASGPDGRYERVAVTVGETTPDGVVVTSGVQEGQLVLLRGEGER